MEEWLEDNVIMQLLCTSVKCGFVSGLGMWGRLFVYLHLTTHYHIFVPLFLCCLFILLACPGTTGGKIA